MEDAFSTTPDTPPPLPKEDADEASQLAEDVEIGARHLRGPAKLAVEIVAVLWALFQLCLVMPPLSSLNADYVRSIHLAFAIGLLFLCCPAFRRIKTSGYFSFLSARTYMPWIDMILATAAAYAALYYALNYTAISTRTGQPPLPDIIIGIALIALLLEAARRALGIALPIVALSFLTYALFASHMPEIIAFRSVSLQRLVGQLTLSSEGIYGVPLDVSARTVFLFVLLGALLEKTGGGHFFVQLAFSLLGRFRGGTAKAAVLSSGFTGLVSGSSIANVVTTGTFTIPLMKKSGYPAQTAAAVEVAASTNGQLMPPIMGAAAFIIAEYCNMPYLSVVRAAFLPAVVSYLALLYITHLEAVKLNLKGMPKSELPRFFIVLLGGVHFLIPLAILITTLLLGFSPALAAFYAILILMVLVLTLGPLLAHKQGEDAASGFKRTLWSLWDGLVAGSRAMMGVGVACAAAGIIVGVVAMGPGGLITDLVAQLSGGNLLLILLLTGVASLILGMGLPTTATYIVMASLTATVIVDLGAKAGLDIPPIAAHLFCFYFGILADDTPPVGLAAYAAAAIAKAKAIPTGIKGFVYDLRTAILPFMFVLNPDLLLLNIHSWWEIGLIFTCATLAMCAFAALTQNFFLTRNWPHESLLLAAATLLLLRPQCGSDWLGVTPTLQSKYFWYGVGFALLAGAWLLQKSRQRPATQPAH
jgi:TRAP transporter 4TM/12TM fusion protein